MTDWNPSYDQIKNLRPFLSVAEERGYEEGESAEEMEVGEFQSSNVFARPMDSQSASYNIMAEVLADSLDYDVRVPDTSYDSDKGVLITSEIGNGEDTVASEEVAETLVNVYAFEALMGQGDIIGNTSADSEGFYAFDFENAGGRINGLYDAVRNDAAETAESIGLDEFIEDYDVIGRRATEMASQVDFSELSEKVSERGIEQQVYNEIEYNLEMAQEADSFKSPVFVPESSDDDTGVEIL